ncbi:la-related protein 6A isoform X1 [Brassica napus]|uniref:la-related protein 6A isoform X1 n=1 Tax=Brassica napus TaxID=3708 RepID=UPI00207868F7|nr:la-related protein 6A isoform X1 [Brassica napus]
MESTEAPSVAVVKSQVVEDAIGSTADVSQPPSHEVDSLRVAGCSDGVVVVSEIPCLTPSDDDFDHGEDRDQDHGDNDDVVVVVPKEDELKQKIIRQVEYYFSDENLPTDKFLLNAMKKNKKGFVPISTIATFHKMKKLTRDHALIVSALKESSFLVVSSDEKKVKRLSPLPEIRDPKIFTVLVENLPEDHTDENIRAIFGKAGSIKSVSICDPNAVEESEKGCKKDKFIRTRLHAFVEYESVEAAEKAAATLNNEQDWRNGLRVKLLEQTGKFAQRRPGRKEVDTVKDNTGQVHDQIGGEENKKSNEHQHHRHHHSDTPADNIVLLNHFQDSGDKNGNKTKSRGRGRRQNNQGGNGHGSSPSTSSSLHHNYHHHHVEVSKPPPGPRMPDGTRGFTLGRGKPLPAPTSAQTSHEA